MTFSILLESNVVCVSYQANCTLTHENFSTLILLLSNWSLPLFSFLPNYYALAAKRGNIMHNKHRACHLRASNPLCMVFSTLTRLISPVQGFKMAVRVQSIHISTESLV